MKKIYKIFIVIIILILPKTVFGADDYVINSYDIDIVVNENNTFDITENITANFHVPKHGIYRKIPLKNTVNRLDGSITKNKVKITNLNVNEEYTEYKEGDNYVIKIGSTSDTVIGTQNYVISYNYNIGKDPLKDKDEFYFNIIGNNWDTTISNITFNILMPKDFDSSTIGFSSGKIGNITNENINYTVNGNLITGSYNGTLEAKEALTIRCELPEGYFVNKGLKIELLDVIYIIPLLLLIISIIMWHKYGKDDKIVETVEFYPPSNFNSLEVGFLYKGTADDKDVISLLIYLANLGYISIVDEKNKGFKIKKLKDYDGNNANEKLFLDNLFTQRYLNISDIQTDDDKKAILNSLKSKNINSASVKIIFPNGSSYFSSLAPDELTEKYIKTKKLVEVTSDDLYDYFYNTIDKILANMNDKENENKIFEASSTNKNVILNVFIIIIFSIITITPFVHDPLTLTASFSYGGVGAIFIYVAINIILGARGFIKMLRSLVISILFCSPLLYPFIMALLSLNEPKYILGYIYGVITVAGIIYIIEVMPKRTKYSNKYLGKIKGFKTFLETAEKEKLEVMVTENPNYFYNILPYAYVLGVSDKWIKKFETISLQAPSWSESEKTFNTTSFSSYINKTMSSVQSAMTARENSSSGISSSSGSSSRSSSGGGSSGGGSGGGGGGSW